MDEVRRRPNPFYKTVHGIEEVFNVLMIEVNKCICVYILLNWVVDKES